MRTVVKFCPSPRGRMRTPSSPKRIFVSSSRSIKNAFSQYFQLNMKFSLFLPLLLSLHAPSNSFVSPHIRTNRRASEWLQAGKISTEEALLNQKLEDVAHKLKLQVFDVDTGVYGFDSKDYHYGIENIRVDLPIEPSLGLQLTEVAHSDTDHRGLVLVSKVGGNSKEPYFVHDQPKIHVGDTIIGVFAEPDFKESTTGLDYEETVDVINRAKLHVRLMAEDQTDTGGGTISLEFNRLVKRAKVKVVVEEPGDPDGATEIDALAGDNLRLLLMHNHLKVYDDRTRRLDQPLTTGNCGGDGVCGTCLVAIREGEESLNHKSPQEEEITTGRPKHWRAACKTIVGADNKEATIRVRVHPQTGFEDELLHPGVH